MIENQRIGWICCRCQKSNSPDIKSCDCVSQPAISFQPLVYQPTVLQPTVLQDLYYAMYSYYYDIKTTCNIDSNLISANIQQ